MTVMSAWAPLFWSGALIGVLHTVLNLIGADPPAAVGYASGILLAASAIPVLIGLGHRLIVGRHAGFEDRSGDPQLAPIARLVGGRARGAVAVLVEGERRAEGSWGVSGTDRPLDSGTRLEIGSVTKTFTATLLAEMVGRGEVALDDRLAEYVPGVPASRTGEEMTLVDLATHSAGLPRLPRELIPRALLQSPTRIAASANGASGPRRAGRGRDRALARRRGTRTSASPCSGTRSPARPGEATRDLIGERILQPLGLEETAVARLDEANPRAARGHDAFAFAVPPWHLAAIAPAGGIVSTATDLARWVEAQMRPESTPLGEAIRIAHEPRLPLRVSAVGRILRSGLGGSRVGLAWITTELGERRIVWHNGGTGGFGSFVGFDPEAGRGVVALTNSTHRRRLDAVGMAVLTSTAS